MVNGTESRPEGVAEDDLEGRIAAMERWAVGLEAACDRLEAQLEELLRHVVSPRERFTDFALKGQAAGWVTRDEVSAWIDSQPDPWPTRDTVPLAGIAWLEALRAERLGV